MFTWITTAKQNQELACRAGASEKKKTQVNANARWATDAKRRLTAMSKHTLWAAGCKHVSGGTGPQRRPRRWMLGAVATLSALALAGCTPSVEATGTGNATTTPSQTSTAGEIDFSATPTRLELPQNLAGKNFQHSYLTVAEDLTGIITEWTDVSGAPNKIETKRFYQAITGEKLGKPVEIRHDEKTWYGCAAGEQLAPFLDLKSDQDRALLGEELRAGKMTGRFLDYTQTEPKYLQATCDLTSHQLKVQPVPGMDVGQLVPRWQRAEGAGTVWVPATKQSVALVQENDQIQFQVIDKDGVYRGTRTAATGLPGDYRLDYLFEACLPQSVMPDGLRPSVGFNKARQVQLEANSLVCQASSGEQAGSEQIGTEQAGTEQAGTEQAPAASGTDGNKPASGPKHWVYVDLQKFTVQPLPDISATDVQPLTDGFFGYQPVQCAEKECPWTLLVFDRRGNILRQSEFPTKDLLFAPRLQAKQVADMLKDLKVSKGQYAVVDGKGRVWHWNMIDERSANLGTVPCKNLTFVGTNQLALCVNTPEGPLDNLTVVSPDNLSALVSVQNVMQWSCSEGGCWAQVSTCSGEECIANGGSQPGTQELVIFGKKR